MTWSCRVPRPISPARSRIVPGEGGPVLPRGGGTAQNGQTVNKALVRDTSKYLDLLVSLHIEKRVAVIEHEALCLFAMRDELRSLLPGADAEQLADNALLFDKFLERECAAEHAQLELNSPNGE